MLRCLLDCDGVLAKFHESALKLHNLDDPYLREENLGKYGIEKMSGVNILPEQFYEGMDEQFWEELEPTQEFDEIITLVERKFKPENVCILTAPVSTYGCLEGKRNWIEKYLPAYKNRFLIGKPKAFCAGPSSVLIDDSDANIKSFKEAGGKTVTFPRPWNSFYMFRRYPMILVKDWLASL